MICAGVLGSAGIGYKQDFFTVQKLNQTEQGKETYHRYMALNKDGAPDNKGFPLLSDLFPAEIPPVAGIDNAKLSVFKDYSAGFAGDGTRKQGAKTTLESDLETLSRQKAEGKSIDEKLEESLKKLQSWWEREGKPNYEKDKAPLNDAKLNGAKNALLYTAVVPVALAIGFLILIIYFALMGGYKQVHLEDQHPAMEEF
jgi:hypothetical protein